jgi:hypothetical protein
VAVLAGTDVDALEAWFAANVPGVEPPLRLTPILGGPSNLKVL